MFLVCDKTAVVEFKGLERWEAGFFIIYREIVRVFVLTGTI